MVTKDEHKVLVERKLPFPNKTDFSLKSSGKNRPWSLHWISLFFISINLTSYSFESPKSDRDPVTVSE